MPHRRPIQDHRTLPIISIETLKGAELGKVALHLELTASTTLIKKVVQRAAGGYRVETIGTPLAGPIAIAGVPQLHWPGGSLLAWSIRISQESEPNAVEQRYIHEGRSVIRLDFDSHDAMSADSLAGLIRASEWILGVSIGKAPGPERMSRADARRSLIKAGAALADQGLKVTIDTLSEQMILTPRGVRFRLKRAEWRSRDVAEHPEVLAQVP